MSDPKARKWDRISIGAFLLCFFTAGIPFWRTPYAEVNLPNAFYGVSSVAVFVTGALLATVFRFSFQRSLAVSALVFPAVLLARVLVEASLEPSLHNLWPLALAIAAVFGFITGGAGALLGWLLARVFR